MSVGSQSVVIVLHRHKILISNHNLVLQQFAEIRPYRVTIDWAVKESGWFVLLRSLDSTLPTKLLGGIVFIPSSAFTDQEES